MSEKPASPEVKSTAESFIIIPEQDLGPEGSKKILEVATLVSEVIRRPVARDTAQRLDWNIIPTSVTIGTEKTEYPDKGWRLKNGEFELFYSFNPNGAPGKKEYLMLMRKSDPSNPSHQIVQHVGLADLQEGSEWHIKMNEARNKDLEEAQAWLASAVIKLEGSFSRI